MVGHRVLGRVGALAALCVIAAVAGASHSAFPAGTHGIHVDLENPAASDNNPGTEALPLRTINRAAHLALDDNERGTPVTVLIHSGTYRETISIPAGRTSAALTFQATQAGKVVVSGSDIWKGWTRWGDRGMYSHSWPYTWGLAPLPSGWPVLQDIVRRREMVFVNGQLLTQVLGRSAAAEGTFYVDEAAHVVYIWPRHDIDPNAATVEVAVREALLVAEGPARLTIRGLVFQHAATPLDGSAVAINGMTDVLIEDAAFRWNNWGGFGTSASTRVTVRRSVSNHNGARGMLSWRSKTVLYEDNETSYNDWRGAWGGLHGWTAAGIKIMRLHGGVFRHHRAVGNQAWGFWLDSDNEHVSVEDGFWCGNASGAFIELTQGPITISRAIICDNRSSGILTSLSQNVTLKDSILYGNAAPQFEVNDYLSDTVDNWETHQMMTLRTQSWTLCGNAIVDSDSNQFLLSVPDWEFFRSTFRSSRNDYWNPGRAKAFRLRGPLVGGRVLDLGGWQEVSRQDVNSVFADPRFADPGKRNFRPLAGSPWQKCSPP